VLALHGANNQPAVEIRNARDVAGTVPAATFRRYYLSQGFKTLSLVDMGALAGTSTTRLGVLGVRKSDNRVKLEIKDVRGLSNPAHIWFAP